MEIYVRLGSTKTTAKIIQAIELAAVYYTKTLLEITFHWNKGVFKNREGTQWSMSTRLEYVNYADEICHLSLLKEFERKDRSIRNWNCKLSRPENKDVRILNDKTELP